MKGRPVRARARALHPDGTPCLDGRRRVPRGFTPCCAAFDRLTRNCVYDLRVEWWGRHRRWFVRLPAPTATTGLEVRFCPHCGARLGAR